MLEFLKCPSGFEKLQISVDLSPAGGQIFRNSNLTGSFPTPTLV
jgi:hypothetical protein